MKLVAQPDYFQIEPTLNAEIDSNYAYVKPFADGKSVKDIVEEVKQTPNTRLFILARHGQGYHNLAVERYTEPVWDRDWAFKNGDGVAEDWADANLTAKGIDQVKRTGRVVFGNLLSGTWPDSFYSSPLRRCLQTFKNEWEQKITVEANSGHKFPKKIDVLIKEKLRETIGCHTCDWRQNKKKTAEECCQIKELYPGCSINFEYEEGFKEKDPLYSSEHRESDDEIDARMKEVLEDIWTTENNKNDQNDKIISVTCHEGVIRSCLRVLNHTPIPKLETSGVVMVVIKDEDA
ncbi:hypothetical protein QEN19_004182 [Hanseniaspora menglaensis]